MCDPVSLAITAATTLAQSHFQNKGTKKNEAATRQAQESFNNDVAERRAIANTNFQDSINQSTTAKDTERFDKAVADRTADNMPKFNQRMLLPGQGNASDAVKTSIIQTQDRSIDQNADAAEAAARLGAYGDSALGQNIAMRQNSNRINQQGGYVQGALNNLQADTAAAAHAGDGSRAIADMIGGIGQLASAGYGAGAGAGWWGGTDPTTGIRWDAGRVAVPKVTPVQAAKWPAGVSIG